MKSCEPVAERRLPKRKQREEKEQEWPQERMPPANLSADSLTSVRTCLGCEDYIAQVVRQRSWWSSRRLAISCLLSTVSPLLLGQTTLVRECPSKLDTGQPNLFPIYPPRRHPLG